MSGAKGRISAHWRAFLRDGLNCAIPLRYARTRRHPRNSSRRRASRVLLGSYALQNTRKGGRSWWRQDFVASKHADRNLAGPDGSWAILWIRLLSRLQTPRRIRRNIRGISPPSPTIRFGSRPCRHGGSGKYRGTQRAEGAGARKQTPIWRPAACFSLGRGRVGSPSGRSES